MNIGGPAWAVSFPKKQNIEKNIALTDSVTYRRGSTCSSLCNLNEIRLVVYISIVLNVRNACIMYCKFLEFTGHPNKSNTNNNL